MRKGLQIKIENNIFEHVFSRTICFQTIKGLCANTNIAKQKTFCLLPVVKTC